MNDLGVAAESTGLLFGYGALMIVAFVASFILGRRFRAPGKKRVIDDPDTLAMLARDANRYVDVVLTRLLVRGAIIMEGRNKLAVADRGKGETALEKRVLALSSPFKWRAAQQVIIGESDAMVQPMTDQGLFASPQQLRRRRLAQIVPFLLIFLPAALLWLAAWNDGRWAFGLGLLLALTGLMIAIRWIETDRRTTGGIDTLNAASARHDRLERGAPRDELVMGVSLFGAGILAGSAFDDYHKLRASSDGGGDAGSSSDSGGGCGGGGCGGGCS